MSATSKWIALALLGLAIAGGVAFAASRLVSEQIGIASESVSAGYELAPAVDAATAPANGGGARSDANGAPARSGESGGGGQPAEPSAPEAPTGGGTEGSGSGSGSGDIDQREDELEDRAKQREDEAEDQRKEREDREDEIRDAEEDRRDD